MPGYYYSYPPTAHYGWLHKRLVTSTPGYINAWLHKRLVTSTPGYINAWLYKRLVTIIDIHLLHTTTDRQAVRDALCGGCASVWASGENGDRFTALATTCSSVYRCLGRQVIDGSMARAALRQHRLPTQCVSVSLVMSNFSLGSNPAIALF